jgi:predicted dehydrogenase
LAANEVNMPHFEQIVTSSGPGRFRVLLVGGGEHARESRGPALLALAGEGVELAALASPTPARRAATATALGIAKTYASVDAALAAERFDGAVIVAPVRQHEPLSVACLRAGLHVLCEKPMASDAAAARRMTDAARTAGRVLAIGYQYPWTQPALARLAAEGRLGDVWRAEAWWVRRDGIPPQPAFWDHPAGGPGEDLLGHLLSVVALGLPGRPARASARAWSHFGRRAHGPAFRGHDTLEAIVDHGDGRSARLVTSWSMNMVVDEALGVRFHGTDRTVEVPLMGGPADAGAHRVAELTRGPGGTVTAATGAEPPLQTEDAFVAQMRNWVRACRGAEALRHDARAALEIQEVLDAALASAAAGGAAVDLPDWQGSR